MSYQQTSIAPAYHLHAMKRVRTLLDAGAPTRITQFDINTIELQRGDVTERFARTGSEQVKGDFDELIELVGGYPYLAAPGVAVARRIVS